MQMLLESTIFCTQQVTNRLHSGQPPLRGVTASLGQSLATLGGAAREQYAAMEGGGCAVEAPPKKGHLNNRPAFGVKELHLEDVNERWQQQRNNSRRQQGAAAQKREKCAQLEVLRKQAGEMRSPRPYSQGSRFHCAPGWGRAGKRDKYR